MRTVLWGGRRGDVQYASREFWRRNLRVGVPTIEVNGQVFDVGEVVEVLRGRRSEPSMVAGSDALLRADGMFTVAASVGLLRVDSMEGSTLAVLPFP